MDHLDDFINDAIHILVEALKGKDYEKVRRVNYLVNLARKDDLKDSLNKLKNMSITQLSHFADMITRIYKDDKNFLENEIIRLEMIFITDRVMIITARWRDLYQYVIVHT